MLRFKLLLVVFTTLPCLSQAQNVDAALKQISANVKQVMSEIAALTKRVDELQKEQKTKLSLVEGTMTDIKRQLTDTRNEQKQERTMVLLNLLFLKDMANKTQDIVTRALQCCTKSATENVWQRQTLQQLLNNTQNNRCNANTPSSAIILTASQPGTTFSTKKPVSSNVPLTTLAVNQTATAIPVSKTTALSTKGQSSIVKKIHSCREIWKQRGTHDITIRNGGWQRKVFCDSGWTCIMRRHSAAHNFDRLWKEYQDGFFYTDENYWIGLQPLYDLLKYQSCALQIVFETLADKKQKSITFPHVALSKKNYILTLKGEPKSDLHPWDLLLRRAIFEKFDRGVQFSSRDHGSEGYCSRSAKAGFWFTNKCYETANHCQRQHIPGKLCFSFAHFHVQSLDLKIKCA